jgi:hypothetical protein
MNDFVMTICTVVGALGGLEFVKWAFNLGSYKRNQVAQAEVAEMEADRLEIVIMKENMEFLQGQLNGRNEEIAEKNELLRKQNEEILSKESENVMLKSERQMKLCERRCCKDREPQSGY